MVSLTTVASSMVFIVVTNQSDFEFDPSTGIIRAHWPISGTL
jgi:hypothetical protein